MDPLEALWKLHEDYQEKPDLTTDAPSGMGSPNEGTMDHPVIQKRAQVDRLRASGVKTSMAHEKVHGEVNLADVTQKSDIASTFGRVQDDGNSKNVHIDTNHPERSIMAIDYELEKKVKLDPEQMKTKIPKQVPHDHMDTNEDVDYNEDIMYLQKYGRA